MGLLSYNDFIAESEKVSIDKDLREYTLTHVNADKFNLKGANLYKEFSVLPYKKETLDELKKIHSMLANAIDELNVQDLYKAVIKTDLSVYDFGKIYTTKFSLKDIPELSTTLEPEQQQALASSEREFLLNNYSQLPKGMRDSIIDELRERAEVLCVAVEALFYYVRLIDTDNFYNGKTGEEIVEDYQECIDRAIKEQQFSADGPFTDMKSKIPLSSDSEKAYWECEKNMKKFFIRGTVNPKQLQGEDTVGGLKGLKFALLLPEKESSIEDYSHFDITELSNRIKSFYTNILKK